MSISENIASMHDKLSQDETYKLFISWWHIWFTRNIIVFFEESLVPCKVAVSTIQFHKHRRHVQGLKNCFSVSPRAKSSIQTKEVWWVKPPENMFKINFDGSKVANGGSPYGFVIQDSQGSISMMSAGRLHHNLSILTAEAWGMREGIREAISLGISHLIIEGDGNNPVFKSIYLS